MKREELEAAVKNGTISADAGIRLYYGFGFHLDGTKCPFRRSEEEVQRYKEGDQNYAGLVRDADTMRVPKSYAQGTITKRSLLEYYFPDKFNANNRDLSRCSAMDIGKVFHEVLKRAREQAKS